MSGLDARARMATVPSIHIVYASTSGHTEYVVGVAVDALRKGLTSAEIEVQRVEKVVAEDLLRGDILVLASSTWNTGGSEGQLNPHMHELLRVRAKDIDLQGKKVLCIGLGDSRYHFTARALTLLEEYVTAHGGTLIPQSLKIVNEPYGQEDAICDWAAAVADRIENEKLKIENSPS